MALMYVKDKNTGEQRGVQVQVNVGGHSRSRYFSFFHNPKSPSRSPMTEQERKKTIDMAIALNDQWIVEQKRAAEDRKTGTARLVKPATQPVAANGLPKGSPKITAPVKRRAGTPERVAPLPGLEGEPANVKRWRALAAEWSATKLSAHEFAERKKIGKASFYRYIELFNRERESAAAGAERPVIAQRRPPVSAEDRGDIVAVSLAVLASRRDGPPQVLSVQYRDGSREMYDRALPESFHEHGYTVLPTFRRTRR